MNRNHNQMFMEEAVYRRQEKIDNLINWTVGIFILLIRLVLFAAIIYFIGKH